MTASPYLTRADLANKLGVSLPTVDRWRKRRLNPILHMKLGGVKFIEADVEQWMKKFKREIPKQLNALTMDGRRIFQQTAFLYPGYAPVIAQRLQEIMGMVEEIGKKARE